MTADPPVGGLHQRLVASARELPPVSREVASAYRALREPLCAFVDQELGARADLPALLGGNPVEVMKPNHLHHAAFVSTILQLGSFETLARTLPWVYRAYRGRGFSLAYFPVELEAWRRALRALLPEPLAGPVLDVYRWMADRHPELCAIAEEAVAAPPPAPAPLDPRWSSLRARYTAAMLSGDTAAALEAGRSVLGPDEIAEFLLAVVQPAMYTVGEQWEAGQLSVAQEHLATAITNRVVLGLDAIRAPARARRGRAIVSAAPNEHHQLGAWMVADLLEADGWTVSYLGANAPEGDLVALVREERPDLLALSVTMYFNLERAQSLIGAVRRHALDGRPAILLGGWILNQHPELREALGADAWASDARQAVEVARRFGRGAAAA